MLSTTSTTTLLNNVSEGILSLSFDVIIILSIVAFFFVHALYRGKSKGLATLIALFIAALIASFFPYWEMLLAREYFSNPLVTQMVVFGIIFLVVRMSTQWMVFGDFPDRLIGKIAHALVLAVFSTLVLLFFSYHIIPLGEAHAFSSPLHELLSSDVNFSG